ncbi:MAG TPA: response regulator [Candidatus Dormibacteraeota bacterium]|jgi:two-component system, chemotaxis family, chemotaxis protein CheY|nr:response regulator [Candidatus Dormibacteraeota bacterium]
MAGKRILVVDDDPSIRLLLRLVFESSGYDVSEAPHGVAALIRIRRAVPDLVVTDMLMPVMDGGALIKHLKSDPQTAEVPIVAVTGDSDAKAQALDADVVMSKPFHQSALLEIVNSLLGAQKLSYG